MFTISVQHMEVIAGAINSREKEAFKSERKK